jgi:hypothetical protein
VGSKVCSKTRQRIGLVQHAREVASEVFSEAVSEDVRMIYEYFACGSPRITKTGMIIIIIVPQAKPESLVFVGVEAIAVRRSR